MGYLMVKIWVPGIVIQEIYEAFGMFYLASFTSNDFSFHKFHLQVHEFKKKNKLVPRQYKLYKVLQYVLYKV